MKSCLNLLVNSISIVILVLLALGLGGFALDQWREGRLTDEQRRERTSRLQNEIAAEALAAEKLKAKCAAAVDYVARWHRQQNPESQLAFSSLGPSTIYVGIPLPEQEPAKTAMKFAYAYALELQQVPATACVMYDGREVASHTYSGPLPADAAKIRTNHHLLVDFPIIGLPLQDLLARYGKPTSYDLQTKQVRFSKFTAVLHGETVADILPP